MGFRCLLRNYLIFMKHILFSILFILWSMATFSQNWLNTTLYPFKNHYINLNAGKMHYIDEGEGEVLLFVHGTPTWSFLYRDIIKDLSKSYRCIAIDHIGFGLSDKPESFPGTPELHSENLKEFVELLELTDITLIVHDFGGPIGLAAAITNPDRIKNIVLFNTWLWETSSNKEAQKVDKILNSGLGRFMYLKLNFSPKVLLKKGFSDKKLLSKEIHDHYIKPFPNKSSRYSLLRIGQGLVGSSDWYQQQWENLNKIENKNWLILWGTKDEFVSQEYLEKWKSRLPEANIEELDCGHFVQEEKTDQVIIAINSFMKRLRAI